jgi:hypothetical protein
MLENRGVYSYSPHIFANGGKYSKPCLMLSKNTVTPVGMVQQSNT